MASARHASTAGDADIATYAYRLIVSELGDITGDELLDRISSAAASSTNHTDSAINTLVGRLTGTSDPPLVVMNAHMADNANESASAMVSQFAYILQSEFGSDQLTVDEIRPGLLPPWHSATNAAAQAVVRYQTNGFAVVRQFAALDADMSGWPDGAAMFVRSQGIADPAYSVAPTLRLVGYGMWPTNDFQSVWWRSGTNVYVNILLEE